MILGTAVGDALGLPAEGLSRTRIHKRFGTEWRQRFVFDQGMVSDDTEHTFFVAQSLLQHPDSPERFEKRLAWCLRGWLLAAPAGIGLATLRAILRLWVGFPPARSGVFSAGNGPAMRIAPIGALFADAPALREAYIRASTRLTHSDPKACIGASAVANLIAWTFREDPKQPPTGETLVALLLENGADNPDWRKCVEAIAEALRQDLTVADFAERLGLSNGVTGYMFHTVPMAVYAWRRHFGSYRDTLTSILNCGGDTDTTGAIAGALAGAVVGDAGIPEEWLRNIWEWPRGIGRLRLLADRLAEVQATGNPLPPVPYFWPGILPRNACFLLLVLLHGFRRLVPPY